MESRHILFFLLLLAALSLPSACSEGKGGNRSDGGNEVAAVVPCFADEGEPVLRVNGVPVSAAVVARFVSVLQARGPERSEEAARMAVIEEGIIPQAAVYALYSDRLPALTTRIKSIQARLEAGEDFPSLAGEVSDDHSRMRGGDLGLLGRTQPGAPGMSMQMESVVFATPVGENSAAFASPVGFQIVKITEEKPGMSPRLDRRGVAHILLHYDAQVAEALRQYVEGDTAAEERAKEAQEEFRSRVKAAVDGARVEILDPGFQKAVYPFRRRN